VKSEDDGDGREKWSLGRVFVRSRIHKHSVWEHSVPFVLTVKYTTLKWQLVS
jgi:hypothetical protein